MPSKMGQKFGSENRKEGRKILTQKRQAEKEEKVIQLGSEQAPRQSEVESVMRSEKMGGSEFDMGGKIQMSDPPMNRIEGLKISLFLKEAKIGTQNHEKRSTLETKSGLLKGHIGRKVKNSESSENSEKSVQIK